MSSVAVAGGSRLLVWLSVLCLIAAAAPAGQAPDAAKDYVARGRQTEVRQRAHRQRTERTREALAAAIRRAAPDLLPRLEPNPPIVHGYRILPRIVPDAPPKPPGKPQVVRFSWLWTETLIAREEAALDRLEANLSQANGLPATDSRTAYEALVTDYKARLEGRRLIDANVDYNWLWQKRIAESRALFDRLQAQLDAELRRAEQPAAAQSGRTKPMIGFEPLPYVRFEEPAEHEHLITVPLYTDITDAAIVEAFVAAVHTHWRARVGDEQYRARVIVTTITPERLYCEPADAKEVTACAAPALAEKIDLAAHAKRFPEDGAVLTTGARSLQLSGNRALVLGPHDVSPRTLAHEFGHLLGFPDAYLRGYRDLGADGFQVLELVPDPADIMSSSGGGAVFGRHFQELIAAGEIQREMQAGLAALYQQKDAANAVARFRAVLERNPEHFGATFQLAKALDQSSRPDEALVVWKKMLEMAEAIQNTEIAATARARLAAAR